MCAFFTRTQLLYYNYKFKLILFKISLFFRSIPFKSYVELSLEVHCDKVRYLEHVQAKINLTTNRRGDIHIYLISPKGTRSTLVAERPMDNSRAGFINWPFM